MLAVARGLMAQPEILMCDELSLGLAPFLVLNLFEILQKLKAEGLTILLVEQNIQMALAIPLTTGATNIGHWRISLPRIPTSCSFP